MTTEEREKRLERRVEALERVVNTMRKHGFDRAVAGPFFPESGGTNGTSTQAARADHEH